MIKKITLVLLSALILGGCSLDFDTLMGNKAATDTNTQVDTQLDAMPSPGVGNDTESLELDISNTVILEEDFSDLY